MDIPSGRWSTGEIMLVIVPIAVEPAVFQEVWSIILIPPVTIALVTINLGITFAVLRIRGWEARIIGMLLGGIAGLFLSLLFYALEFRLGTPGVIGSICVHRLEEWAGSLVDPGGGTALTLRFIGRHMIEIEGALQDILGVATIWAGGRLDHCFRQWRAGRRAAKARSAVPVGPAPPLDSAASSPL
jgi:hypothetical protein